MDLIFLRKCLRGQTNSPLSTNRVVRCYPSHVVHGIALSATVSQWANPHLGPRTQISSAGFAVSHLRAGLASSLHASVHRSYETRLTEPDTQRYTLTHRLVSQEWKNKYIPFVLNRLSNTRGQEVGRRPPRLRSVLLQVQATRSRRGEAGGGHIDSVAYSCMSALRTTGGGPVSRLQNTLDMLNRSQ